MSWSNWFDGFSSWLLSTLSTSEIIAICAVFLSWRTIKHNRDYNERLLEQNQKHNELSLRPNLVDNFHQTNSSISLELTNSGLGPAHIQSFEMLYQGSRILMDDFQQLLFDKYEFVDRVDTAFVGNGYSILAGASFEPFKLVLFNNIESKLNDEVTTFLYSNFELIINYECNYENKFIFKTDSSLKH